MTSWQELERKYFMSTVERVPVTLVRGQGARVWDEGGREYLEYNNIEAIKSATTKETCAVMLEPVQGEGGVNLPDADYLAVVRAWCDQMGILLILDEIQTGVGRTGTLFAYEQYGIEPDIMTLAKGKIGF